MTKELFFYSPKCRHEFTVAECPTQYLCFCGKEVACLMFCTCFLIGDWLFSALG